MKKYLAMILAGVMAFSCTGFVWADETETEEAADEMTVVDYTMISDDFDALCYTLFDLFDLCIPSDWEAESTDEPENNVYFTATNDDQTESVAVSAVASEYTDINDVAEAYAAEDGYTDVEVVECNDISCVSYENTTDGVWSAGLVALDADGNLYNITVGCSEDEKDAFQETAANILLSFMATEGEAETETEA